MNRTSLIAVPQPPAIHRRVVVNEINNCLLTSTQHQPRRNRPQRFSNRRELPQSWKSGGPHRPRSGPAAPSPASRGIPTRSTAPACITPTLAPSPASSAPPPPARSIRAFTSPTNSGPTRPQPRHLPRKLYAARQLNAPNHPSSRINIHRRLHPQQNLLLPLPPQNLIPTRQRLPHQRDAARGTQLAEAPHPAPQETPAL